MRNKKESKMRIDSFKDKVVWLTGASSGIGEALAYSLSEQGAKLILSSRCRKALKKVRNNCAQSFSNIHILPLDLSRHKTIERKANQALNIFGRIDVMIHNAGVALKDLAVNTDLKTDKKIMDINYFGTIALTKAVLRPMQKRRSGHFVVLSSVSGKLGVPKSSSYSASKHALHGFFDSLRAEVARDNIKITMVVPGFIKTNITVNALKGDGTQYGKMMRVQEKGMTAALCVRKILKAVSKDREEAVMGGPEILTIYLKRFFPILTSKIMRNHPVKKWNAVKKYFMLKKYRIKIQADF
jgi:short-subunit dehydrogenase